MMGRILSSHHLRRRRQSRHNWPPLLAAAVASKSLLRNRVFKNLLVYRIGPAWALSLDEAESLLEKARFEPCSASQAQSAGWVPPRGQIGGALIESVGGHWLLTLMTEQKVLPSSVVKRRTDEIAQRIEQDTGRKPGRKQTKEIKEQAVQELLPMAFTRQTPIKVWIAPQQRLLMIDASSAAKGDAVITLLVKSLDGLAVQPLQTTLAPATAMAQWLATGEVPEGFSVDRECELKADDESKAVVRYARHLLDTDDVRQHISAGKIPTRLALTWQDRVSFVLTEALQIKKLGFEDVVFENQQSGQDDTRDDGFDTDAAIATGELTQLIPDLVAALDGELVIG